jgi:hypothetical protein
MAANPWIEVAGKPSGWQFKSRRPDWFVTASPANGCESHCWRGLNFWRDVSIIAAITPRKAPNHAGKPLEHFHPTKLAPNQKVAPRKACSPSTVSNPLSGGGILALEKSLAAFQAGRSFANHYSAITCEHQPVTTSLSAKYYY